MTEMFEILSKGGSWGVATIAIFALGWLFRLYFVTVKEHRAELEVLHNKVIDVLEKVLPVTVQVPEAVQRLSAIILRLENRLDK